MARVTRRKFLKVSGAGTLALKAGGMAGILAAGRAPAYAQTTTVHWLRWNDFVPACDQLLRQKLLPEAEKSLGIKVNYETVNGNDLQPRITSGIQSGAGPDILMLFNNHPHLYKASLVDLDRRRRGGRARRKAAYYNVSNGNCSSRRQVLLDADGHHRRHERLSQIAVRRGRLQRVPEDLGPVPRRRQEAEGQGLPDRPVARPVVRRSADLRLSAALVVRRHGDRRQGQGRASTPRRRSRPSSAWSRPGRTPSTRAVSPGTTPPTTARSWPARSARP